MRLDAALRRALRTLEQNDVGSARMNAETLLMFVLGCDRAYLYAHPERKLTGDEENRYNATITERATGKPAQYITGHQEFWGLDFIVSPAVLIPRPETEHVIETVLELARAQSFARIADVGTGSGCIAVALAKEFPVANISAVDISPAALEIARANAARHQVEKQIAFGESDLLAALPKELFDLVVSNPPYVGESEADKVQKQVREFEPKVAVFSGIEGMDIYRRLIPQARAALTPGGWLVMEMGYSVEQSVRGLLAGWENIRVTYDLQGIPRVIAARKPAL
ncbi:MAG: peptide chain release factor N(5)-glutamine methyltransferase [Candidatus Koribacter versatilis]|uniref:Release factor glutamine methyltransferase n=1 Tax=Candidatus Korobacter versatilis TaxID=658062 RepID=A0A932A9E2_9BACT|nr:peptide chain release factor N(5)-glutamine methyltransferase [Candidatus Koribacter versatilis]